MTHHKNSIEKLRKVDSDLWVVDDLFSIPKGLFPFPIPKLLGQAGVRMTIIRLSDGGLLIHSPIKIESSLKQKIQKLGPVKFIVAPNVMHNSFILSCSKIFPKAAVWVAPKTSKRCPDLKEFPELEDSKPIAPKDLDQALSQGHTLREVVFYHRASKTLIVTDFACNIGKEAGLLEKLYSWYFGAYGKFALPNYHRKGIRDSKSFKKFMQRVLSWDFDRIIMSHGKILENGGKEAFRKIWKWAL